MAKYKYEVYEVSKDYYTDTIYGTERTEYFQRPIREVYVYRFYSSTGSFSYYGGVNVEYSRGYYYELKGSYYEITESFSGGGSRGNGWLKLIKVRVMSNQTKGNLIETITADENAYPTSGIKDGKWYIRREKIAEIKAKFNNETLTKAYYKDSQNVIKKLSKAYFKDGNGNIIKLT